MVCEIKSGPRGSESPDYNSIDQLFSCKGVHVTVSGVPKGVETLSVADR
jgi:hypothetical protein